MLSLFRRLNAGEAVFDFIGKRRRFYWISAALLLLCVGSFIFRGFNLGIEFSGGTQFQFKASTAQPAEVQQVAQSAGAEVANTPQIVGSGGTRSVLLKAGELAPAEQTKVVNRDPAGLRHLRPEPDQPVQSVGPVVGQ